MTEIPAYIAGMKNTHLMEWLGEGYGHCQHGAQNWCQSYLDNARDYIEALEALVIRVLQDERDGGWQDIETAPKDFKSYLVYAGGVFLAHQDNMGRWRGTHNGFLPAKATHWRPLPSPPHTFTPDQIAENLNERHEAGERA